MNILVIQGRLPGMNEITKANRSNRHVGGGQKKNYDELVIWSCKACKLEAINEQVDVTFTWYCKDKRRDKDNIMAGQKFIFDGLQKAGILKNDGWKEIGDINHRFILNKTEKVEVEFTRHENKNKQ